MATMLAWDDSSSAAEAAVVVVALLTSAVMDGRANFAVAARGIFTGSFSLM
jgi:hypothetical protein